MTQSGIKYYARKFTITTAISEQIDELAEEHSGGNASQLVRSAIKSYAHVLEGHNELEFKKLQDEVEQIGDSIEKLTKIIEDNSLHSFPQNRPNEQKTRENEGKDLEIQRQVHTHLMNLNRDPQTLREISNKTDVDSLRVQDAVNSLLRKDFVKKKSDDGQILYQICPP